MRSQRKKQAPKIKNVDGNLKFSCSINTLLLIASFLTLLHLEYSIQQVYEIVIEDHYKKRSAAPKIFSETVKPPAKSIKTSVLQNTAHKNKTWNLSPKIGANLVIIGAAKCGTAVLVHFMSQHSQIVSTKRWESHFWDRDFRESKNESDNLLTYAKNFEARTYLNPKVKVWVEKTPNYVCNSKAFENLALFSSDMNFILLVCNPVERAWSHYQQVLRVPLKNYLICYFTKVLITFFDTLHTSTHVSIVPLFRPEITNLCYKKQLDSNIFSQFTMFKTLIILPILIQIIDSKILAEDFYSKLVSSKKLVRGNVQEGIDSICQVWLKNLKTQRQKNRKIRTTTTAEPTRPPTTTKATTLEKTTTSTVSTTTTTKPTTTITEPMTTTTTIPITTTKSQFACNNAIIKCKTTSCPISCPWKTGYYADASDCRNYCYCTGSSIIESRIERCGPGTFWDPTINACNHKWATKTNHCQVV